MDIVEFNLFNTVVMVIYIRDKNMLSSENLREQGK